MIDGEYPLISIVPDSSNVTGCCSSLTSTLQNISVGLSRPAALYLASIDSKLVCEDEASSNYISLIIITAFGKSENGYLSECCSRLSNTACRFVDPPHSASLKL